MPVSVTTQYLAHQDGTGRLVTDVPEPDDGRMVVVQEEGNERVVYRRDDTRAQFAGYPDENWYHGDPAALEDPRPWTSVLQHAVAVYDVSAEPVAKAARV